MSIIKAIFEGYKAAKEKNPDYRSWEYDYLLTTPYLHSSQYLGELYEKAKDDYQKECIVDHLNRHNTWGIKSYDKIQKKFIDERWK